MTTARQRRTRLPGRVGRRWTRIVIDTALLVAFVVEFVTREGPDYAVHSWVGIALVPIIAVHLTGNLSWIRRVWRRGRADRAFGLGVLNASFALLTAVCIATGFPIWLEWSEATAWTVVHTATGLAAVVVMVVHDWRNRGRIIRLARS